MTYRIILIELHTKIFDRCSAARNTIQALALQSLCVEIRNTFANNHRHLAILWEGNSKNLVEKQRLKESIGR